MEKEINNLKLENGKNFFVKNNQMKNENFDKNEFNFSFGNIKEAPYKNFFPYIGKESENLYNDFEDDNKEENSVIKDILDDLNKNIEINIKENENNNYKACKEILNILKYPHSDKNIRDNISPFKPLTKPRKVSLIGKVFFNFPNEDS